MNASLKQLATANVFLLTLVMFGGSALAQGTATGPFTNHIIDPGPSVTIASPLNPMPIDLDPLGPPWFKSITDPNGIVVSPSSMKLTEYIINVGTEPWYDWHEIILPPPAGGTPQSNWLSVGGLAINGIPIGFTATGLNTPVLDLNNFSQPVLPGDTLEIIKELEVFPTTVPSAGSMLRIQEYPTPEPTSAILAIVGAASLLLRQRERN